MNITAGRLKFLQGILLSQERRAASQTAEYLSTNYRIGVRIGRNFEYGPADVERATALLTSLKLPLVAIPVGTMDRGDAAVRPGLSEKSGTHAPHAREVAFAIYGSGATFTGAPMSSVGLGYQVAKSEDVGAIQADITLVVENLETLAQLRRYRWLMRFFDSKSVLAVFRGDTQFKVEDAADTLRSLTAPVWAAFDFDPAGLGMASKLQGLVKIVLPSQEVLTAEVLKRDRSDLFYSQFDAWAPTLDACQNAVVRAPWELMKRLKRGLNQEWMREL